MIKKIIGLIVLFVIFISISQTITLGSYIAGKNREGGNFAKNIILSVLPYIYTYCFGSPIYYSGIYNKTNKIDIITSNHLTSIDFGIYLSLIRLFDDRDMYFVMKKDVMFIPGSGFILGSSPDLKLNRKLEDDMDNIINTISKIKEGVIVIMPEGTRFTEEKQKLAQQYSIDNNLPVFKNTLYPKMKGLWTICNILNQNNKLGNIIDMSCMIQNFKNKTATMKDIMLNDMGNTFGIINTYNIPNNIIEEYDDFKNWYLSIWIKKDYILSNINQYTFKKLKPNIKSYELLVLIIIITFFFYLTYNTNGLYLLISFIITYIITFIRYKKISKDKK